MKIKDSKVRFPNLKQPVDAACRAGCVVEKPGVFRFKNGRGLEFRLK
jgi:hypothetical protein